MGEEDWKVLALYEDDGDEPVLWLDGNGLPRDDAGLRLDPWGLAERVFTADVPVPVLMLSRAPTLILPRGLAADFADAMTTARPASSN